MPIYRGESGDVSGGGGDGGLGMVGDGVASGLVGYS